MRYSCSACALDDQRLRIGALQFDGAGHEALDRVGDIVRLVEHVRRLEVRRLRELGFHQFVEHQEQPERLDRAGVEIVVAVLRVVEMEAAEALRMHQARDDHFDVHVGRVVARGRPGRKPSGPASAPPSASVPQSWMTVA